MKPAFAYLRVSGKNQIEGDGFTRQLDACFRYAAQHSFTIVKVFREEGVSGTNDLADRPALSELFAALLEYTENPPVVLIEKLDRLARDVVVQEVIIRDIIAHRWELISTMEPDSCSSDPTRKFIRQIFGAMAEYERELIVMKLRGARQRMKAKTGRCEGVKPFGCLPGEDTALRYILASRQTGTPPTSIARHLNTLHPELPTRSGKPWSPSSIDKILRRDRCSRKQSA